MYLWLFSFLRHLFYNLCRLIMRGAEMLTGITNKEEKERIRARLRKEPLNGFQSDLALSFPSGEVYVRVGVYIRTHHRSFTKNAHTSLDLQELYYERFLEQFPGFKLVRVYSDFPRPAGRPAFERMLNDCKRGKLDLIITKSMSRFAPNMKECLEAVQMLHALQPPVGVFFETENIYTLKNTALFTEENAACLYEQTIWREPNAES